MNIHIDNTLIDMNIIGLKTDSAEYKVILSETSYKSGVFVLELKLVNGHPVGLDVYKIISTTAKVLTEPNGLLDRNNSELVIITIAGESMDIINKKTNIFTRWIKAPWEYEIVRNPEYKIEGSRDITYLDTNMIKVTKSKLEQIKKCSNCHNLVYSYKFCPNCGKAQ